MVRSEGPMVWSESPKVRSAHHRDHRTVALHLRTPHRRPIGPCGRSSLVEHLSVELDDVPVRVRHI